MISLNLAAGHVENLHLWRFMMKVTIHFLMLYKNRKMFPKTTLVL